MKERIATVMGRFGRFSAGLSRRPVNSHTHKQASILFHMGGADLLMRVQDRIYRFKHGDMLMLDAWVPHARGTVSSEGSQVMNLLIEPEWLEGLTGSGAVRFCDAHTAIPASLQNLTRGLWQEMFDGPTPKAIQLQEKVEQLIETVVHAYTEPVEALQRKAAADARVRQAFEDLRNSAIQGVKIEELAAGSGMSRSHFFRQFKRCIGVSPQHVIDEERVAYALRALSSPGIMLSQLSEELGFSAPAHFTRFFVQHLGYTPSQFKRNLLIV